MADGIAIIGGKASIAFVGEKCWHGMGQNLTKNAPLKVWAKEAGLDYPILSTPVQYTIPVIDTKTTAEQLGITNLKKAPAPGTRTFKGRRTLYRGDTGSELSIVSDTYKIVQPVEVLEFFRDLVAEGGGDMYLETAGALFGGTKYWAMANTNREADIIKNDRVKCRLLLTTSCDGTLATTAKFIAERVVCNNTLKIALGEVNTDAKSQIRVTHGGVFDPTKIKVALGLMEASWEAFLANAKRLAKKKITDLDAKQFISDIILNAEQREALAKEEELHKRVQAKLDTIFAMYKGDGMGADMVTGTLWGALNAVTEFADHRIGAKDDNKVWNSWFGYTEGLKNQAYDLANALA